MCYSGTNFFIKAHSWPRATWPNSPHTLGAGRGPCSELGTSPRTRQAAAEVASAEEAKESAQLLSSGGDAIGTFPRPIGCIGFPESELARARGARAVAARLAHLDLLEFLAYGTSKACTSIIVIAANILSPHKSSSHSRRTARPLWSSYLGKTRGEDVWLERASRSREASDTIMQRPAAAVG